MVKNWLVMVPCFFIVGSLALVSSSPALAIEIDRGTAFRFYSIEDISVETGIVAISNDSTETFYLVKDVQYLEGGKKLKIILDLYFSYPEITDGQTKGVTERPLIIILENRPSIKDYHGIKASPAF